jgi:hypothetical protein
MKHSPFITTVVGLILLTGCATYQISTTSLTEQLNGNAVSKGYLMAADNVKGNDLEKVRCIDKNGKETELPVTNRTGVKITKTDNSKTTFYFNTLLIKDSSIVGSKTHFFNAKVKPIKLNDIIKIEIMK